MVSRFSNKNKKNKNGYVLVALHFKIMDGFCVICKKTDDPLATVKEKGFSSLLKYSKDKKDHDTIHYLQKKAQKDLRATVLIHNECRKKKSRGGLTRGRGFSESMRHQWVHTAHQCAVIHETMSTVTKIV